MSCRGWSSRIASRYCAVMALSSNEWAAKIANRVGRQVAHYRGQITREGGKTGITAQALAERCQGLGLQIDRTVIAKLEKGTRQTITIGEVIVLARALGVPPVALMFELGVEEQTEIIPDLRADTWDAVKWFTGEAADLLDGGQPGAGKQLVQQFRRHDALVGECRKQRRFAMEQARGATAPISPDFVQQIVAAAVEAEDGLRRLRSDMRGSGVLPPALPEDLQHVELDDSPGGQLLNQYAPKSDGET